MLHTDERTGESAVPVVVMKAYPQLPALLF